MDGGVPIVPVAVQIQGRNNERLTHAATSGVPAGLTAAWSHVSSADIWVAFTGTPSGVGRGTISIETEAENGVSRSTSFDYVISAGDSSGGGGTSNPTPPGVDPNKPVPIGDIVDDTNNNTGNGNKIDPINQLPPGIELGLGETGGKPITHLPPGNVTFTPQPSPTTPGGNLLPGYTHAADGFSFSIDLGNNTSGDVFALEYEMNLLGHPLFANWRSLNDAARLALLLEADARLVYEYAVGTTDRASPAFLIGTDGFMSWAEAVNQGVVRLTETGIAVRYVVTDRDMDPFTSAGFLVIPDGRQDNRLIDPLWLLVRDEEGPQEPVSPDVQGGGGGCNTAAGTAFLIFLICGFFYRRFVRFQ